MKRRTIIGMICFILFGIIFPWNGVKADSTDAVIYDAAEFESFRSRTREEIGRRYGEALYAGDSYNNADMSTYYETMYSLKNPYNAGKLTEDTHKTMTGMTEFYRWLTGAQPLQADSVHSDKLQAEALVRNFEFNHTISDSSKPEDMTQELWDYGAKNYIHTILARYSTPRNAITSWMNEGYRLSGGQWDTVGHRYALIGAEVSDVQFGYAGNIAVGQEKAYENTLNNPYSAFPAPGYMPSNLIYSSSSAWSIEINTKKISISDSSNIIVRVTNLDSLESYECTTANRKLAASRYSSVLAFVQPVPVSGNRYTGRYRVEVTGLSDVETGKDAVVVYTTEFFDPTEYTPSYVKKVTIDGIETYIIYKSAATKENLTKIAYALPAEVTIIAENGRRVQVPVTGKWVLDEEKQAWCNQADAAKLPADITDREQILKQCMITYQISNSVYDSYNTLNISPSVAKEGDAVSMHVYLTQTSADTSAIFQLIPQKDGSYSGIKKYDSRISEGFEKTKSGDHVYHIPSVQKSDKGEYFSVFYDSADTRAYVSTQITTLEVNSQKQTDDNSQSLKNKAPKVAKISQLKIKVTTKGKKKSLSLKWDKVAKASGYQVQVSTKKNFKGTKTISVSKNKRQYKTSKLKKSKKYYVRVRAYRNYKNEKGKTKKAYGKWKTIRI